MIQADDLDDRGSEPHPSVVSIPELFAGMNSSVLDVWARTISSHRSTTAPHSEAVELLRRVGSGDQKMARAVANLAAVGILAVGSLSAASVPLHGDLSRMARYRLEQTSPHLDEGSSFSSIPQVESQDQSKHLSWSEAAQLVAADAKRIEA